MFHVPDAEKIASAVKSRSGKSRTKCTNTGADENCTASLQQQTVGAIAEAQQPKGPAPHLGIQERIHRGATAGPTAASAATASAIRSRTSATGASLSEAHAPPRLRPRIPARSFPPRPRG